MFIYKNSGPLIGVTGPTRGGTAMWHFTRFAVHRAGGRAVRLTPAKPHLFEDLDGLILGGGADVDPLLYCIPSSKRETAWTSSNSLWRDVLDWMVSPIVWAIRVLTSRSSGSTIDRERDALEIKLLKYALDRRLPILGICRGEQLLNVYFGGSLHQQLRDFYVEAPEMKTVLPRKEIRIAPESQLSLLIGRTRQRVNSLHKQAIDRIGDGLTAVAWDRNKIVQAVEHTQIPFLIGVQWHPEYLPQVRGQRRLFERLVEYAKDVAQQRVSSSPGRVVQSRVNL